MKWRGRRQSSNVIDVRPNGPLVDRLNQAASNMYQDTKRKITHSTNSNTSRGTMNISEALKRKKR